MYKTKVPGALCNEGLKGGWDAEQSGIDGSKESDYDFGLATSARTIGGQWSLDKSDDHHSPSHPCGRTRGAGGILINYTVPHAAQ